MRAAPPGRRPSNKPVAKFRGDKLVDGVTHNPHGRTDEEEAAYILADPVKAAEERRIFEAELAEAARLEEEQKLLLQRAAESAKRDKQAAAEVAAAAIEESQKREAAEVAARQKAAQQEEAARRAEAARVVDARIAAEKAEAEAAQQAKLEKESDAARRAEAARVVDARIAAEKAEAEAAARAEAEAADERRAQEALQERIAAEKIRRERARQEESDRARAEEEADRLAARQEAAAKAEAARAALAAANEEDTEELREKRRLAEEKRRKRAAFLDDMDGFSTDFIAHNEKTAQQNKQQLEQTEAMLAQQLADQAKGFVPVASNYVPEEKKAPVPLPPRPVFTAVEKPKEEPKIDEDRSGQVFQLGATSSETFDSTASALFTARDYGAGEGEREEGITAKSALFDEEPLRAPTRVGSGKAKGTGRAAPLVESSYALKPNVPVGRIGAERKDSVVPSLSKYDPPKNTPPSIVAQSSGPADQYTEEEGFGTDDSISNVLTREERAKLTTAQKAHWVAKQDDLGKRRKGFHGAVTYAFDGIFSWQMYGSAEAVDESGSTYTEYLMRCQWGTSWDNLQPWISARRYREFDVLDAELRRMFPNYERAMPQLPGKDFFRFLEADVIDKRRQTLENYMSRIVLHLPTILRSRTISEFLGIQERLVTIKAQFAAAKTQAPSSIASGQSPDVAQSLMDRSASPGTLPASASASSSAFAAIVGDSQVLGEDAFIKTADHAEQRRIDMGFEALTEEELCLFEDELRKLILGLQGHNSTKKIKKTSTGYINLVKLTTKWPQLRATCAVEKADSRSFTLIPRALQAEEDLTRLIRDFEALTATTDHLSVLGI